MHSLVIVSLIHPLSVYRPQSVSESDMSSNDGQESFLKIIKLGVIFSAMLYGCVVTLALNYIPALLQTSHTLPRHMRNFLLVYVTFMVAVTTVNTVTLIIAFSIGHNIFTNINEFSPGTFPNGLAGELCCILSSWGADGFMVRMFKWKRIDTADHFIISARYCGVWWYGWEAGSLIASSDWRCGPRSSYSSWL